MLCRCVSLEKKSEILHELNVFSITICLSKDPNSIQQFVLFFFRFLHAIDYVIHVVYTSGHSQAPRPVSGNKAMGCLDWTFLDAQIAG